MSDTEHQAIVEKLTSTIKLTGSLISAAHEYLWGIDEDDAVPPALPKLVDALEGVGIALSSLRKFTTNHLGSSIAALKKLYLPVAECVVELGRIRLEVGRGDDGLRVMLEQEHIMPQIRLLEKHEKVLLLALQVLQNHSKSSEALGGYIENTCGGDPFLQAAQVLKEKKEVLSWLYSGEYELVLRGIQARSVQGTGEWVRQSPVFQNWLKGNPGFLHLWGQAFGGAGKTHTSAKIIQHIQAMPQSSKYAVAYFLFAHMPGPKQPKDVLRCLILQLACQARHFVNVSRVLRLRLVDNEQPPPTFDKLFRALIDTTQHFGRVFLVLDGVDDDRYRADLLPLLRALGTATANIGMFVTSHPLGLNTEHWLLATPTIDLSARDENIKTYIQQRVDKSPNAKFLLRGRANLDRFVANITECANGRFLYVRLVIQSLLLQPTVNHIFSELEILKAIPEREDRYDTIYTRAIANVRAQPKNRAVIAAKILLWVVKAKEILTVGALREAIAVVVGSPELDPLGFCDKQMMLDVCHDLITIDEQSGGVSLIHRTAQDFLRKQLPQDGDYKVAAVCLTYLAYNTFSNFPSLSGEVASQALEARFQGNHFYDYAAKNLGAHINACDLARTTELFVHLTQDEGKIESYFQVHQRYFSGQSNNQLPLRMAIHVGHLPVVRHILETEVDPFSLDEDGRTALHWAALGNRIDIARLLLDRWRLEVQQQRKPGDNLWGNDRKGNSAMHIAARKGFKELIQLFLDHGAVVCTKGKGGQSSLQMATKGEHEDVVQLLLENGADSLSTEENGRTALHEAAEKGHLGIVTRLLHYQNNIKPKTSTPQQWRARKRNERCDVSASDDSYLTPLHLAALGSHTKVVQLLLEVGANASARDARGETVLHQAARGGDMGSVRLLLNGGADVMPKTHSNVTLLHRAATRGYINMIEMLLDHHADNSARLGNRTAVELALAVGHNEAVQVLISRGAKAPDPANVNSMMFEAVEDGDDALVELLLSHGADPSGEYLINAAEHGYLNVVNLLLDDGASILFTGHNGQTVLQAAAKSGNQKMVNLVLNKVAEIDSEEDEPGNNDY